MPSASPGKKPASTAVAGNLLLCTVTVAVGFDEDVEVGFEEVVEEVVKEGAADDEAPGSTVWSAFFTQF